MSTGNGTPAPSLTCIMVSKLKAIPFHRVNSPLVDPVNNRRPSGVHRTTLTGCLTLFNDECRCRTGIASAAVCGLAAGGSIYGKEDRSDMSE